MLQGAFDIVAIEFASFDDGSSTAIAADSPRHLQDEFRQKVLTSNERTPYGAVLQRETTV